MTTKTAAGSQLAAGAPHARALPLTPTTEKNMTNASALPDSIATADFTKISELANQLADKLGITIVGNSKGFNAYKDEDFISPDCTPEELVCWLAGYESGKDDLSIVDQLDQADVLLDELVKAEQVIQALMAAMDDGRKQAAANSLVAVGSGGKQSACRSAERQGAITAARAANRAAS